MIRISSVIVFAALIACDTAEVRPGLHDDGTASARAIPDEGSDEATIALYLANTLDEETLDIDVTLDSRAAANIVDYRAGDDGVEGTDDDQQFETVAELDAISYVGSSAFTDLVDYGWAIGLTGEAVHGVLVGSAEEEAVLYLANMLGEDALDVDVALDSRAAANIVDAGTLSTLDELDAVSYVGVSAMTKLVDYAADMIAGHGIIIRDGVPYGTLQDAVDADADSITIDLYKGTYTGSTTISSTLIVRGYADGGTVMDGEGTSQPFFVEGGAPCFYDMEITRGNNTYGGGMLLDAPTTSVVLSNVTFSDNSAVWGGALSARSVPVALYDTTFVGNRASSSGGAITSYASISGSGNHFEGNTAYYAPNISIFSWDRDATFTMSDSAFIDNIADGESELDYGAIHLYGTTAAVTDSEFSGNTPSDASIYYFSGDTTVTWDAVEGELSCTISSCD